MRNGLGAPGRVAKAPRLHWVSRRTLHRVEQPPEGMAAPFHRAMQGATVSDDRGHPTAPPVGNSGAEGGFGPVWADVYTKSDSDLWPRWNTPAQSKIGVDPETRVALA